MKEFDELIFSFMSLDLNQKKAVLSSSISENIDTIIENMKVDKMNTTVHQTNILNELKLNDENDYLTHVYILTKQLEDITSKYISLKNSNNIQ